MVNEWSLLFKTVPLGRYNTPNRFWIHRFLLLVVGFVLKQNTEGQSGQEDTAALEHVVNQQRNALAEAKVGLVQVESLS